MRLVDCSDGFAHGKSITNAQQSEDGDAPHARYNDDQKI